MLQAACLAAAAKEFQKTWGRSPHSHPTKAKGEKAIKREERIQDGGTVASSQEGRQCNPRWKILA